MFQTTNQMMFLNTICWHPTGTRNSRENMWKIATLTVGKFFRNLTPRGYHKKGQAITGPQG